MAAPPPRVLVVDDEPQIRRFLRASLTAHGYAISEAASGAEAIARLDRQTFDVLVTDLALPGISGEEVAAHALRRRPAIRVVFATGYAAGRDSRARFGAAAVLQKPYNEQTIAAALRAARSA